MASVASRHIENVVSVGTSALGPSTSGPESLFYRSWMRCMKQHGLDPTRPTPARILPSHQVREHQQRMDGFLRVARAGMEDMYRRVCDLGYMLLLTDAEGITVDYIGNPASETQLKAAGLYLGADWNEAHAGTCGVGTCLIEQATITCHQAEHFDATHIALTCTSAPLFAPDGQLLGVLDVSALHSPEARESQHLALHLASMYAQLIEDANFLRSFGRHAILRLGTAPGLVEVAGTVMFAYDGDGVIVGANTGARRSFGRSDGGRTDGASLIGMSLSDVLGIGMDAVRRIASGIAAWPSDLGSPLSGPGSHRLSRYHPCVIPPRFAATAPTALHRAAPAAQAALARGPARSPGLDTLGGDDRVMLALLDQAKRLVDRGVNLLISGETGTGKEVLARALHAFSRRADQPFVAVNCASIPDSLIESELFGYTPGSFTGGKAKGMKGLIAQSDGGTLFLDEIGDMPLQLQTRLLRVLSESEVLPLGAEHPVALKLSVIAATHRDLRDGVAAGTFREDLYYRLCGATLALPPLRQRQDKAYLVAKLLAEEAARLGCPADMAPGTRERLLAHPWPGNIRELRNALRFALAVAGGQPIRPEDLPPELRASGGWEGRGSAPAARALAPSGAVGNAADPTPSEAPGDAPDATRLLQVLKARHWNISSVARDLGICRATVYRQMKRHAITPPHLM